MILWHTPLRKTPRIPSTYLLLSLVVCLTFFLIAAQNLSPASAVGLKSWSSALAEQWNVGAGNKCSGWDPDAPEEADPKDCLRARRYRQTQRVLEREIKGEQ